jgi:NADH-quinone oxidoreductase subunit J
MSAGDLLFYLLALLVLGCAAMVAFSRNIVHSAFALLGTFMGMAGLYAYLAADLLAVIQMLVYVGGILVVILFAVMLTGQIEDIRLSNRSSNLLAGIGLLILLLLLLVGVVALRTEWPDRMPVVAADTTLKAAEALPAGTAELTGETSESGEAASPVNTTRAIGNLLLSDYLLPFEVISVVLVAALIGAVTLIRKEES